MERRTQIPLVTIEEHHEAFCIWQNAIWRGWIQPRGNALLHVDEHSDLSLPILRTLPRRFGSAAEVATFAYRELAIGTFIWPAVFAGIFDQMIWLRPAARTADPVRFASPCVRRWTDHEVELVAGWHRGAKRPSLPDGVTSIEIIAPASEDIVDINRPFVLDIDLDYFASHRHAQGCFELEVTVATFREFTRNPYHFLRLAKWDKFTAHRNSTGYVIRFGEHRQGLHAGFTNESVRARCDRLWAFLAAQHRAPSLITVCRSIHSGYTPRELAGYIEESVIDGLGSRYDLSLVDAGDLIPAECQRLHPEEGSAPPGIHDRE